MKPSTKETIIDVVLPILGLSAMLVVAVIAPNAVQIFDNLGKPRKFSRRQLRLSLKNMERQGYVQHVGLNTSWEYRLTKKGEELLKKKQIEQMQIPMVKHWDGKWRVVIFDIPEKGRSARDALRAKLQTLGFKYINLSVWVHPYECRDEISALTEYFRVGRYVRYLLVDQFDGDQAMKRVFNL